MKKKKNLIVFGLIVVLLIIIMLLCSCCGLKNTSPKSGNNKSAKTEAVKPTDEDTNDIIDETEPDVSKDKESSESEISKESSSNETISDTEVPSEKTPSSNAEQKKETSSSHSHKWTEVYQTVTHNAETKQVWVVDKAAYTEEVPVYESKAVSICNACGEILSGKGDVYIGEHIKAHMLAGESGGHHKELRDILTGFETVTHPEEGHYETTIIKEAYTETILTGYKCSCGATKSK